MSQLYPESDDEEENDRESYSKKSNSPISGLRTKCIDKFEHRKMGLYFCFITHEARNNPVKKMYGKNKKKQEKAHEV